MSIDTSLDHRPRMGGLQDAQESAESSQKLTVTSIPPAKAPNPIFLHPSFSLFLYISKQGRDVSLLTAKAMPVCSCVSLPLRAEHTHRTQATRLHSLGPWDGHTLTKWDPPPHCSTNPQDHTFLPRNTGVPSPPVRGSGLCYGPTHQQHRTELLSSETCKGPTLLCEPGHYSETLLSAYCLRYQ